MPVPDSMVFHLIAADAWLGARDGMRYAIQADRAGRYAVYVGPGRPDDRLGRIHRVTVPFGLSALATRGFQRLLRRLGGATSRLAVHVWSPRAYAAVAGALESEPALVIELDAGPNLEALVRLAHDRPRTQPLVWHCHSALARRILLRRGVREEACRLTRPVNETGAAGAKLRESTRAALGLAAGERALVVLPPVARYTGTFIAVWAALLVQNISPDVRLIVPGEGPEVRRAERLVSSVRHLFMTRFTGSRFGIVELISAADACVYLPSGAAPLLAAECALEAQVPVVCPPGIVPGAAGVERDSLWPCSDREPQAVARTVLAALERT